MQIVEEQSLESLNLKFHNNVLNNLRLWEICMKINPFLLYFFVGFCLIGMLHLLYITVYKILVHTGSQPHQC